jgi:hypothetical protein
MTDVMTATTERQVWAELYRIVSERVENEQFNNVPPIGILRVDFIDLAQVIGTKLARLTLRRCGFRPDEGRLWYRPYPRGEGAALVDVDSMDADLREAISDLDPAGLLDPYLTGRAEWG